jgi:putative transposase
MANTYTQIYIHVVFTVKVRQSLIPTDNKEEIYKYITGIVKNRGQKLIAINGTKDHVHILLGLKPTIVMSDLIRDVKAGSSGFINEKKWWRGKFNWQEGFGAFSISHADLENVIRYIQDQEIHNKKRSFREEYVNMLQDFNIKYDNRYIFVAVED